MNTDILFSSRGLACIKRAGIAVGFLAAGMLMTVFFSACGSASVQAKPQLTELTPSGKSAPTGASEFLGRDASLLQPGGEGQAAYVYINPSVQWSNYKKLQLDPVEFWDTKDSSVSLDDQKMLCSYFYDKLRDGLEKNFTLVNQPGPGVITVRVAIINATAATPGLRSISVVIPQARVLNYAQSLATGHAAFAGSAEAAFKATDSVSGQLLAESVDKREGGMGVSQAGQMKWGDAESAMDYWAQKISQRAVELGAGSPNSGQQATKG